MGNHDIRKKKLLYDCWYMSFLFFCIYTWNAFLLCFLSRLESEFSKTVVKDFTNPKFLVFAISKIICKTLNMRKRCGILLLGKAHKCQTRNSTWLDKITKKNTKDVYMSRNEKKLETKNKNMSYVSLFKSMHLSYYRHRKATWKNRESRESRILFIPVDILRKNV